MAKRNLFQTIKRGRGKEVIGLLDGGADPDRRGFGDMTPLLAAVAAGKTGAVQALLAAGARPDDGATEVTEQASTDDWGFGSRFGVPGVGRRFWQGLTPLMLAAQTGKHEVVQALAEAGAEVDLVDPRGLTPLMFAVVNGHRQVVGALLRSRADVGPRDVDGLDALMLAARRGDVRMVRALLDAGADPHRDDGFGGDALVFAEERGHHEVAEVLRARGADHRDPRYRAVRWSGHEALHAALDPKPEFGVAGAELRDGWQDDQPLAALLDGMARFVGLRGLGPGWRKMGRQEAAALCATMLERQQVDMRRLRPAEEAEALARQFISPGWEVETIHSNVSFWDADGSMSYSSASMSLFDVVVIMTGQGRLAVLWTSQDD